MTKAGDTVERWERKAKRALSRVVKESVQDVVSDAQTVQGAGGRMRVDTGFLRASIQGATGAMPAGPVRGELKEKNAYPNRSIDGTSPAVALRLWNPLGKEPFYVGWTAGYAVYREAEDGFMRIAIQKWDVLVEANAKAVRRE